MVMVIFQHLAKGQPLQPDSTCPPARFGRFQSLYRGTAFATITTKENIMAIKKVSIPLPRDSLCNRDVAEALISNSYNRLFF